MLKFLAVLAILATSVASALVVDVPKLHSAGRVGDSRLIQVQTCNSSDCTGCSTIMEFQPDKCHSNMRFLDHGEILRCQPAPIKKQCFTESVFDNHLHSGAVCPTTALLQSAPRECDVCSQDIFGDPFKFFKYTGCDGTSSATVTLYRGCDWGCNNCDIIVPLKFGQCVETPAHPFFRDFTFQISNQGSCSGDIRADHFFSPLCDGEPNFIDTMFTDRCYFFAGRQHKFSCH